ncbi:hypothetical protein [Streptomyces sp. NBC_00893]|uniref:hypothetical protein n=1 Tax=Streptomyces sp. NBC_00893 TaxID=2975862 RepID=UPI00224CE0E0|nr:hypothetical protein [Streptomyces sp. NBC_00893]MCX4849517.1 hypothetical protein [Streptomyces sp. NBC_00893]
MAQAKEYALPSEEQNPNEILKAFAANRAFRAAEWDELTTESNPYRRPVRPDDLAWLDYSRPLPSADALKLSGFLGHRMLRNVYDLDALYLPPQDGAAVRADREAFYCDRNRELSALAKPVLEQHLFTLLDGERTPLRTPTRAALERHVVGYFEERKDRPHKGIEAVLDTKDKRAAATFLLLQLSAFTPAMNTAVGRAALGEYELAHETLRTLLVDQYRDWVVASPDYGKLLAGAGLKTAAAAYWQLYMNSSLARGNHLHHLSANREHLFGFLGALMHKKIDEALNRDRLRAVFAECLQTGTAYFENGYEVTEAGLTTRVGQLLAPLVDRYGEQVVVEGFHRGFADATWYADLWEQDLWEQVTWADSIGEYQDKARKIDKYLKDEGIEIDLDTFVESSEETSTTHVHDEHRLVVIEAGQMHFWNNVTHKIELNQGDKLLIPVSRLHGSTVLSGECTYHQPIIPDDLLNRIV